MAEEEYLVERVEEQLYNLRKFQKIDDSEPTSYYFRDEIRRIHYVIVLDDKAIYDGKAIKEILTFLDFMEFQGLEFEFEIGLMDSKLTYLKVHATDTVINHFANLYEVDIENAGHNFIAGEYQFSFRMTELTKNGGDVFKREGYWSWKQRPEELLPFYNEYIIVIE